MFVIVMKRGLVVQRPVRLSSSHLICSCLFIFSLLGRLGLERWRSFGVEQMRYFCSLTYIGGLVVGGFPGY